MKAVLLSISEAFYIQLGRTGGPLAVWEGRWMKMIVTTGTSGIKVLHHVHESLPAFQLQIVLQQCVFVVCS